ncbi:hypothetical protein K435DRAFT_622380, partial [Dendrothele bispora CBS 962.96]
RTPEEKDHIFRQGYPANMSDKEILEKQWASWKSDVYKHYKKPTIVPQTDVSRKSVIKYVFVCKSTGHKIIRARYETPTTNLKNHVKSCEAHVAPPEESIKAYMSGGHYNKGEYRVWRALWVARRHRPYKSLTDPEHRRMMLTLNPRALTCSAKTVARDVIRMHDISTPHIASHLPDHKGYFHLSFDGWTSANVLSFFSIDVHHVNDRGDLVTFILDFVP